MVWINIDIAGFIVAVLGLITTILLGWNIYTVVDFKDKVKVLESKRKEIEDILKSMHETEKSRTGYIFNALADISIQVLEPCTIENRECNYLLYKVYALNSYAYIGRIDTCNRIVNEMIAFLEYAKRKNIDLSACEATLEVLNSVKNKEMIDNFHKLVKTLRLLLQ